MRAHYNTLEWLPIFLPSMWLFAIYWNELVAAALPRIVDLAITSGPAELADLASLALQLAPRPGLAAPLADQMPHPPA